VPQGVAPIQLEYDSDTGLLRSATLEYSENLLIRHYGDWREVAPGLQVAFKQEDEDPEDESTSVFVVETASLQRQLTSAAFSAPPPPEEAHFLDGQRASTVPYEDDQRTRIYIPVYLNGKRPFAFELDSGGHFILTSQTPSALGLESQGKFASTGAGNDVLKAGYLSVDSVRIGTAQLVNQAAKVLPWSAAKNARGTKPPRAGLLGLELFERFRIAIDRSKQTVTLAPAGRGTITRARAFG
jgi:hypothetical protein